MEGVTGMEGSLARRSPADVLSELQRKGLTGVLTCRLDKTSRQLHVDAGIHIRFAASNHPAESLTAWFLERGGVPEEQLRRAAMEKRPDEFLGTTLTRLGLVDPAALAELTETHVRRIARGMMLMPSGDFQFQEGALALQHATGGGVLTAEVLLEWSRDIGDPEWVRSRIGSLDSQISRNPRAPVGYQKIRLDPVEGYIMSRVDGLATIREICMVSPMGDDKTLCALLGLTLAGVLVMPAGAKEQAPPALRAAPEAPAPRSTAAQTSASPPRTTPAPSATTSRSPAPSPPAGAMPSGPGTARQPPPSPVKPTAAATPPAAPTGAPPQPAGRAGAPARSGPHGLAPKPRMGMGGRPTRLMRRPVAAAPKPPRPVEVRPPDSPAEIEAEMLRRFQDIHILDLYQVLDVAPVATPEVVRRSYYALARRLHPDTFRREDLKPKAEKVFGRITEAYATLSQQALREKYDQERQVRTSHQDDKSSDAAGVARMNFRQGREHFEHGHLSEALSFLQNACQQDPSRGEYFEYLGMVQATNPRLRKQAEENLLKAIQISPMSASAYAHLGQLYERTGAVDRAREMYRQALQWDPTNDVALKGVEDAGSNRKGLLGLFSRK
jgi:hypothetical protein